MVFLAMIAGCSGPPERPAVEPMSSPMRVAAAAPMPVRDQARVEGTATMALGPEPGTAVPVLASDPSWGNPFAPVTLAVWGDYECPFTAKMMRTTVPALKEQYGADRLRIVWKHFPLTFHTNAPPAHEAAQAVLELGGATAFWRFHELALDHQYDFSPRTLERMATLAGVDPVAFQGAIAAGRVAAKVADDMVLGKEVGVGGTPASFINGIYLSGAQPIEKFRAIIDDQLATAAAMTRAGVPPERLYAGLSQKNKAEPPARFKQPKKPADTTTVWKVPVRDAPTLGSPGASVTLVMFGDFQCPFSKKAFPTVEALGRKYGDRLRLVFMHQPLPSHPRAEPAAELAIEAKAQRGDPDFFAAAALLFQNQAHLDDGDLETYAASLHLDVGRVRRAIARHAHAKVIARDRDLADDLNASGTPHFFINGRRLIGAQRPEAFEAIIDEEIVRADRLLASGTPPAKLYDALQRDATPPLPWERILAPAATRDQPGKGARIGAKLTVQFFADFQCPYCRKAAPVLDEIIAAYPGKVRVVWRHNPLAFHKEAVPAAEAAMEAFAQKGDAGFWAMAKLLFEAVGPDPLGRDALERMGATAGLDLAKLRLALDQHTHLAAIEADQRVAESLGLNGTPAFAIGDYYVSGTRPLDYLRRRVDKALGPHEPPTPETIHKAPRPEPNAPAAAPAAPHARLGAALERAVERLAVGNASDVGETPFGFPVLLRTN